VHESTTFIALALFMKSYRFDKNIFLQIYFGMYNGLYFDKFSCFNTFHHHHVPQQWSGHHLELIWWRLEVVLKNDMRWEFGGSKFKMAPVS
jgi:hypothetical protein